jgi:hypothetical protein
MLWPNRSPVTWKIRILFRLMLTLPPCLRWWLWLYVCRSHKTPL